MKTITSADGTPIAYERWGSGPPLVLVHGTTADRTRWDPIRPALEERFTVYAVDRRGRGESGDVQQTSSAEPARTGGSGDVTERSSAGQPKADAFGDAAEYALEREFEDVAAVVDSVDEPAVLLGHSYGALCALGAALLTDNLAGLVLYEPPILVDETVDELRAEGVVAEMEAALEAGENERAVVLFLERVAGFSPEQLDALRSAPNWPARVEAAHTAYRETLAPADFEFDAARFAALDVPTLLLTGSESAPFLGDSTAAVDEALPDSRVVVLAGQGHAAMNTAPELFVDEVLAFARESPERGAPPR